MDEQQSLNQMLREIDVNIEDELLIARSELALVLKIFLDGEPGQSEFRYWEWEGVNFVLGEVQDRLDRIDEALFPTPKQVKIRKEREPLDVEPEKKKPRKLKMPISI